MVIHKNHMELLVENMFTCTLYLQVYLKINQAVWVKTDKTEHVLSHWHFLKQSIYFYSNDKLTFGIAIFYNLFIHINLVQKQ